MKAAALLIFASLGFGLGLIIKLDFIPSAACQLDCNRYKPSAEGSIINNFPATFAALPDLKDELERGGMSFDIALLKPKYPKGHDYIVAYYYSMASSMTTSNLVVYRRSDSPADKRNYVKHCVYLLPRRDKVTCRVSLLGLFSVEPH